MTSGFTPTQAELALTAKIFDKADPNKLGIITGDVAVNVFKGSKLSPSVLGKIWTLADKENNGFLTRKGVAIALRLMGHAQRGEQVTESLSSKVGLPPTIDGYTLPILQQNTGSSANLSSPLLPSLTVQDKAKFLKIFSSCNPVNGMLSGDKAREIFVKSKLPVDKLSQIWNLADTYKRGSLDATDFNIAMYLVQACMSGQLTFVPTTLPPGLYEQASVKPLDAVAAHSTGSSLPTSPGSFASRAPSGLIQPQFTGSKVLQPQITGSLSRLAAGPPALPSRPSVASTTGKSLIQRQITGQSPQWDITPMEKANADRLFDQLDTVKRGFIEGDVAGPVMLQSALSPEILAQIWDLADIQDNGHLTRESFAVAIHLIQKKLSGKDLPSSLPPSLIPPSMRANHTASSAPQPSAQESIQDLLWDDTPLSSATVSPPQTLQPQRTGTLQSQPLSFQPQVKDPLSPSNTGVQQQESAPQSQSSYLTNTIFSGSNLSGPLDLLGDDLDTGSSPPLHDRSAEIGNTQNQLNSTNRALETVKTERADVEQTLAEQAAQLSSLQTKLTSAKAAYGAETRLLETLRERYANQNTEIKKLREELITAESDVSALRLERNDVSGNLLKDKEEIRDLQKKMASTGAEIETLKVDIEKAKKDAKQQRGLLAIAKKQLATREIDRSKVELELQEVEVERRNITKELEEAESELNMEVPSNLNNGHDIARLSSPDSMSVAIAQPLPLSPETNSQSATAMRSPQSKSTNPFDRLTSAGTPRSGTPLPASPSSPDASSSMDRPIASGPSTDDPFDFSNTFSQIEEPKIQISETGTGTADISLSTPKLGFLIDDNADAGTKTHGGLDLSPGSEHEDLFSTPPSTAAGLVYPSNAPLSSSPTSFIALDAAATHFPLQSSRPPPDDVESTQETDLNSVLKELDVAETDSSDEGHEEVNGQEQASQPVLTPDSSQPASTFDNTFGISLGSEQFATTLHPVSTSWPTSTQVADPAPGISFDSPLPMNATPVKTNGVTSDAAIGKHAFDEAMGIMSADNAPAPQEVTQFDSAFDDNFDFAAAKAETEKPFLPPRSNTGNGTTTVRNPMPLNNGFDNAFGLDESSKSALSFTGPANNKALSFDDSFGLQSLPPTQSPSGRDVNVLDARGITFDTTHGGQRLSRALAFDDVFAVPKTPPPQQAPSVILSSPPASPSGPSLSHATGARRTASPSTDPVTLQMSPKGRPSTVADKLKEPQAKHSRISIRLPFRKKKTDPQPPIPRSSQLPSVEDAASDDDLDVVKQLTAMGFSRDDAVAALERSSYDFQGALNSLLDAP